MLPKCNFVEGVNQINQNKQTKEIDFVCWFCYALFIKGRKQKVLYQVVLHKRYENEEASYGNDQK